jgi:hypothetical protein
MHRLARAIPVLLLLGFLRPQPGYSQTLSVAAASGPVFLPRSGVSADWQGSLAVGIHAGAIGGRLEGMLTGVPGADLVALTGNLVWSFRRASLTALEPYLIAGVGSYVKFSESRFGLNGGAGVGRRAGPLRLFVEMRYHRVTHRFDEAHNADTFIPLSVGVSLGG